MGNSPLCSVFPRLFRLESNPNCCVKDRAPASVIDAYHDLHVSGSETARNSTLHGPNMSHFIPAGLGGPLGLAFR